MVCSSSAELTRGCLAETGQHRPARGAGLCASQRASCGRGPGDRTQVTEASASHEFTQRFGLEAGL